MPRSVDSAHNSSRWGNDFLVPVKPRARLSPRPAIPTTPVPAIPPRASAQSPDVVHVRPRYPRGITLPDSQDALDIDTLPTNPNTLPTSQAIHTTHEISPALAIDELDTRPPQHADLEIHPPASVQSLDVDKIETWPIAQAIDIMPDIPTIPMRHKGEKASPVKPSLPLPDAEPILTLLNRSRRSSQHPFETLRWWLIRPGHIEFLFWLGGTLLLVCFTGLFMLAITANLYQPHTTSPAHTLTPPNTLCTQGSEQIPSECTAITVTSPTGLQVVMLQGNTFVTGSTLPLRGLGFTPKGQVQFTHDGTTPCLPASAQATQNGEFSVILDLTNTSEWQTGSHSIQITDTATQHTLALSITLTARPVTPTANPQPSPTATAINDQTTSPPINTQPEPDSVSPDVTIPVHPTPTLPTNQSNTQPETQPTQLPTPTPVTPTATPDTSTRPSPTAIATPTSLPETTPTASSFSPQVMLFQIWAYYLTHKRHNA